MYICIRSILTLFGDKIGWIHADFHARKGLDPKVVLIYQILNIARCLQPHCVVNMEHSLLYTKYVNRNTRYEALFF